MDYRGGLQGQIGGRTVEQTGERDWRDGWRLYCRDGSYGRISESPDRRDNWRDRLE